MGTTRQQKPVSFLLTIIVPCALFLGFQVREACAGKGKAIQEAVEYAAGRFAGEVAEESVERISARLTSLAAKHGDDAIAAFKKVGPQALRVAEEAGEHAGPALRLMASRGQEAMWVLRDVERTALFLRFGDDAAEAMIRHKGIATPLIKEFEGPAAKALNQVDARNARRIRMMAEEGDLARIGRTGRVLGVVERYGDRAADFVWRNKGGAGRRGGADGVSGRSEAVHRWDARSGGDGGRAGGGGGQRGEPLGELDGGCPVRDGVGGGFQSGAAVARRPVGGPATHSGWIHLS